MLKVFIYKHKYHLALIRLSDPLKSGAEEINQGYQHHWIVIDKKTQDRFPKKGNFFLSFYFKDLYLYHHSVSKKSIKLVGMKPYIAA